MTHATNDYAEAVTSAMSETIAQEVARLTSELTGPIWKSAGGKSRLLPELLSRLPPQWRSPDRRDRRYYEPFCGGAALYFALCAVPNTPHGAGALSATLGDLNVDLVELYAALVHDVEAVIRSCAGHVDQHERDPKRHYYFMRELFNDPDVEMGTCERAALTLYLNRAGFNGLWRVNRGGKFNVPIGRQTRVAIDPARLRVAARHLSGARLWSGDYTTVAAGAMAGDLVYFDPPYDRGFVSYTRDGFTLDDHARLAAFAGDLARRGVYVMLSHADTDAIRELYREDPWRIAEVTAPRSISASGLRRLPARELVITSYEPGASS